MYDIYYLSVVENCSQQVYRLLLIYFGPRCKIICLGLATAREGFTSLLSNRVAGMSRMLKYCLYISSLFYFPENSKGSDQTAQTYRLVWAFVFLHATN